MVILEEQGTLSEQWSYTGDHCVWADCCPGAGSILPLLALCSISPLVFTSISPAAGVRSRRVHPGQLRHGAAARNRRDGDPAPVAPRALRLTVAPRRRFCSRSGRIGRQVGGEELRCSMLSGCPPARTHQRRGPLHPHAPLPYRPGQQRPPVDVRKSSYPYPSESGQCRSLAVGLRCFYGTSVQNGLHTSCQTSHRLCSVQHASSLEGTELAS